MTGTGRFDSERPLPLGLRPEDLAPTPDASTDRFVDALRELGDILVDPEEPTPEREARIRAKVEEMTGVNLSGQQDNLDSSVASQADAPEEGAPGFIDVDEAADLDDEPANPALAAIIREVFAEHGEGEQEGVDPEFQSRVKRAARKDVPISGATDSSPRKGDRRQSPKTVRPYFGRYKLNRGR